MPAYSDKQAKFMRVVRGIQQGRKGTGAAAIAAKNMKPSDVEDMMNEEQRNKIKEYVRKLYREMNVTGNVQGYLTPKAFTKKGTEKEKVKHQADLTGYSVVNENRWLELKKEGVPVKVKIGRGLSNINKQLNEVEKFLTWYGRLKQENGLGNQDFWKRTNRNIFKIKERLIKLEQNIRKIAL